VSPLKVLTILGTRPEIIRLSRIIPRLDALGSHVVVHTGQNYDATLDEIFFRDLGVRKPDHYLGARGSFGAQIGTIISGMEEIFAKERPDRFLVLGDTNSSLAAIAAKRMGIPVYHMEAGNRCYDDRVPEEVNRRIIDHCSDVLLPYTMNSKQNLLREGIPSERILVTGNPIWEVIRHYDAGIQASTIVNRLGLRQDGYFLVTMHRAENVDLPERLTQLTEALRRIQSEFALPVIISTHPRTRARMAQFGLPTDDPNLRFLEPFGFFDFVTLEKHARCVLSDSGTVQEECSILRVPNVTIRDVTERPETLECGSNILTGADPDLVLACTRLALSSARDWNPPAEYVRENVAETVVRIVTGFRLL
jgi:UDP-N-acetylglucosamine 2-epimerase (non-hydrolysing)